MKKYTNGTRILVNGREGQILFLDKRENKYCCNILGETICILLAENEFTVIAR